MKSVEENKLDTHIEAVKEAAPPVAAPSNGSKVKWTAGVIVLVLLSTGGIYAARHWGEISTDDAQVDGTIATVSPKIAGNILEVLVNDNQPVKAGDVLVRIDARDYQAKVDQERAELQLAESEARAARVNVPMAAETTSSVVSGSEAMVAISQAEYDRARAALDQAQNADLSYARSNIENKQANFDRAQADLNRMKALVAKEEISQQQYDSYVAASKMAESDLHAAKDRLASANRAVEIAQASLSAAQARVQQTKANVSQSNAGRKEVAVRSAEAEAAVAKIAKARANLAAAELQLSYATLVAPIDGVVTRKAVEVGNMVQPGQSLLALIPMKGVYVTANFKETQLAGVRPGQKAEIKVDMYGRKLAGTVDSVSSATGARMSLLPPENASGNYVKVVQRIPVKILVDPASLDQYPLRVGMNVEATIFPK